MIGAEISQYNLKNKIITHLKKDSLKIFKNKINQNDPFEHHTLSKARQRDSRQFMEGIKKRANPSMAEWKQGLSWLPWCLGMNALSTGGPEYVLDWGPVGRSKPTYSGLLVYFPHFLTVIPLILFSLVTLVTI